jgi:hypothetical protein
MRSLEPGTAVMAEQVQTQHRVVVAVVRGFGLTHFQ